METVVLLSHKKPDGHINVKVEFGEGEGKVPLDNIAKRAEEASDSGESGSDKGCFEIFWGYLIGSLFIEYHMD